MYVYFYRWGGCMVALVAEDKIDSFKNELYDRYYVQNKNADGKKRDSYLFSTEPEDGATILFDCL